MNASQNKSHQTEPNTEGSTQLSWPGHMADDVAATYGPEPMANLTATAEFLSLSGTRGNLDRKAHV